MDELITKCPLRKIDYESLQFGESIGEGILTVYEVFIDGKKYAGKVYDYENLEDYYDSILYETQTAVKIKGLKQSVQTIGISEGGNTIVLIMEYLESVGDTFDYLQQRKFWITKRNYCKNTEYGIFNYDEDQWWSFQMSEKDKIHMTLSLVSAICELHKRSIIHGDIKTNNTVFHKNMIHLIDFGMAYRHTNNYLEIDIECKCGTPGYMAPEQYSYKMSYKSDIYSIAVTIIEIWNGELWIDHSNNFKVCRKEVLLGLRRIEKRNSNFGSLLRRCLSLQKDKRPSSIELDRSVRQLFQQ